MSALHKQMASASLWKSTHFPACLNVSLGSPPPIPTAPHPPTFKATLYSCLSQQEVKEFSRYFEISRWKCLLKHHIHFIKNTCIDVEILAFLICWQSKAKASSPFFYFSFVRPKYFWPYVSSISVFHFLLFLALAWLTYLKSFILHFKSF